MRIGVSVVVLLGMVCAVGIAQEEAPEEEPKKVKRLRAMMFRLMDSYDESFLFKFPREKPVLLTFGDQGAQGQVEPWREALEKRYGDGMEHCAVAWLEGIPEVLQGAVKKIIREGYDWVLLDWTGDIAQSYRCKPSVANVFVIGTRGAILFEYHGEVSEEHLNTIYGILDKSVKRVDET